MKNENEILIERGRDYSARNLNLTEAAEKLKDRSVDILVPAADLKMNEGKLIIPKFYGDGGIPGGALTELLSGTKVSTVGAPGSAEAALTKYAHRQVATNLEIPRKYYKKMAMSSPGLLDENVNTWLQHKNLEKKTFLLRNYDFSDQTDDGAGVTTRALLSSSYAIIDNYDILLATLEAINDFGLPLSLEACDVTEQKFYARFRVNWEGLLLNTPDISDFLGKYNLGSNPGENGIFGGFVMTNSEVGSSSFTIIPRLIVGVCQNGMIFKKEGKRKKHLGARMDGASWEWSQTVQRQAFRLVKAQIRESVRRFSDKSFYENLIKNLREVAEQPVAMPNDAIRNVTQELNFTSRQSDQILNAFMDGGGKDNAFRVAQALTYFAQHQDDSDLRYEVEAASVEVMQNIKKYDRPFIEKKRRASEPADLW